MIGGQGNLGEVCHESQQQHGKRRHDELAGHHIRDGHKCRFQDGPADLIDNPRQDALIDRSSLFNQCHDIRQSRFGQDDACGTLGHIGCRADGDTNFGLAKRRSVVNSVARHASDMPCGLQLLHHDIFVLGKYLRETIGAAKKVQILITIGVGDCGLQLHHAFDVV